jgi:hypothetical protein
MKSFKSFLLRNLQKVNNKVVSLPSLKCPLSEKLKRVVSDGVQSYRHNEARLDDVKTH